MATRTLWIGSYPPAGVGAPPRTGEGVYRVELDVVTGALSRPHRLVETPVPSFVVHHPSRDVVYATDESEAGGVVAFRVHDDALEPLGTASSGGAYPCHLGVDGDLLLVANYGDGVLGVLPLADDGGFTSGEPYRLTHVGGGPRADRQAGPHAHFAGRAPGGHVVVVDLGTDELRRYARTPAGLAPAGVAATLPPGTGPRHVAFARRAGGWFGYVSGELEPSVHVLAWDPATDTGEVVQSLPVPAPAARPHAAPPAGRDLRAAWAVDPTPSPSHVALEGDELVLGVRGPGLLARFAVGADALLTHRADQPLPGPVPRDFAVVGPWTVVAEQVPGAVTVLDRGGAVVSSQPVPSAACVAVDGR